MAMNYQNFASLGVNLNRQKYGPLDISNVFTSENDLKYYLSKGNYTEGVSTYWYKNANERVVPYPYEGQVLATVIDGVVEVFVLALDAEGNFETREIAGKIEVDGTTIVKDADGKLSIVAPVNPDDKKTYNFSYANGVYSWVEVDTATAAGQAQAIQGLTDRVVTLETNDSTNAAAIAANTAAIAAEKSAREAAIGVASRPETTEGAGDAVEASGLYAAIEAAEARAKAYADENDANTIYDDTAVKGRLDVIERDYLKIADRYNDSELRADISAIKSVVGDDANGLVKDVADNAQAIADEKTRAEAAEQELSNRIDAIDFVDDSELATAVSAGVTEAKGYTDSEIDKIEAAIAALNHFTSKVVTSTNDVKDTGVLYLIKNESVAGVDKYDEYIVIDGVATLIGDTTTDLSNYYNKTEIDGKVETIESAITDEVEAREALAAKVTALESVDNATQAELDSYKAEVSAAIAAAKSEAISDADGKLADKVNTSDFNTFKSENTAAIGTAKAEAIAAAKTETESQISVLSATVTSTYATKSELSAQDAAIRNELLAYVKTTDVNTELAKKIETGSIAHAVAAVAADPDNGIEAVEAIPEGVTVEGTKLKIVVDAPTRAETIKLIADKVADVTGGESAADVKLNLESEVARSTAADSAHDAALAVLQGNASTAGSVAEAKALAQKGVDDAAQVAADLVTANAAIADNTREIGVAKSSIQTVNETLTGKITVLENKDATIESNIAALQATVSGTDGHASRITALEGRASALEAEDTKLTGLINTKANSVDVYTKTEVDDKVATAIGGVDLTPYAKTADVDATVAAINASIATKADASAVYTKDEANAEFMTQDKVDARINALIAASDPDGDGNVITNIQNLVEYVENNAGEIAALVTTVGEHTTAISQHTAKLDEIDAAIAAIVQPKASAEVTVSTDGTLGIGQVSTDKLVQGADTLVLNGGNAGTKVTE